MDRCNNCQFYDRQDKGSGVGQCRRQAPALSPINAKAYMIEGVWPTVRDDDWCGEWSAIKRKADAPMPDARNLMAQASAPSPIRTAGLPGGSLMAPVAPLGEAVPALNGRFGSD